MDVSRINPDFISMSDEQIDFLNKVIKSKNPENKVTKIDVTEIYEKEFGHGKNENAYCTPYTLLRLFADIVPNMPEKLFIFRYRYDGCKRHSRIIQHKY